MGRPNVLRKVRIEDRWKMLPVARTERGFDWTKVVHRGRRVPATAGTFYLDYKDCGRRVRRAVGDHPRTVKAALSTQTSVLELRRKGLVVEDAPEIAPRHKASGLRISEVVETFEREPPIKLSHKSVLKYSEALRSFSTWAAYRGTLHVSQLCRADLLSFMTHSMRERKLSASTATDKAVVVLSVMRENGASIVMKRGDWPPITELERETYNPPELKTLFSRADAYESVLFRLFLLTGFRDQEVGFLTWPDFDPRVGTLSVRQKTEMGFRPKNYQERTVPIPDVLVSALEAHRKTQNPTEHLIFPTGKLLNVQGRPGGQRNKNMLMELKRLAKRAGLNCGRCSADWGGRRTTCARHPVCGRWGLHKFRHTYATTLLRDGVDIVTVQKLLGHKDLDSTRKYLRALSGKELSAKINASSLASI